MNYQELFLQQLSEFNQPDDIVADIGCGSNGYLNLVDKKLGVGLDIELPAELGNNDFAISDIEQIPLRSGCCDIVLTRMVLEHLKNPRDTVKEIYRILSPGGLFLFVTPHRYYPISLAALLVPSNRFKGLIAGNRVYSTYYRLNTLREIRKFLTSLGFKELKLIKTFDPVSFRFRVLNLLLWIFNRMYSSELNKLLPPHHIIGVFRK